MNEKKFIVNAFSEISSRYEQVVDNELQKFWGWSYEGFVDQLIQATEINDGDRLLDVATGTSVIPLQLIDRGKVSGNITGLDITYGMLEKGKQKIDQHGATRMISQVCGNAMEMPLRSEHFDVIVCGLATHHLDVARLLNEMSRLLRRGGKLTIADVAGASAWRKPPVSWLLCSATFLYFLPKEGIARAIAESNAVSHVLTPAEWEKYLNDRQFTNVQVEQLPRKRSWVPAPLVIRAIKP